jgi:hypothetical protein
MHLDDDAVVYCEYSLEATAGGTKTFGEGHTFVRAFDGNGGYGNSALVSAAEAAGLTQCTFRCTAYIQSIVPKDDDEEFEDDAEDDDEEEEEKNAIPKLLCASLFEADEGFASAVNGLYRNEYFFSETFRTIVQKELSTRQAAAGLTGS